ncbi:AI-2E family transporter [Geodermatophilus normandii]|uniref:AI-2E family transporter n=1 Tax=Geodermatophilus normandii TaxID=1137989 RepID=A0A6P0GLQ3_9ACTN|nr:AI-2E family transporter [Geodermatophilus normandii]
MARPEDGRGRAEGIGGPGSTAPPPTGTTVGVIPAWTLRTMARCGAVLGLAAVAWLAFWLVLRLPLLSLTVALALLVTAAATPMAARLRRSGVPAGAAAFLLVVLLIAALTGIGFLVGFRASAALRDLTRPVAAGVDRIRVWLIEGPLGLEPTQVADLRNRIVTWLYALTPDPAAGARTGLYAASGLVLLLFLVFFLLKDGDRMWSWLLVRLPAPRREQVDGAGCAAWRTLTRYTGGLVVVALIDAVGIGLALLLLGVPLWVSLTLLTFFGAFVPVLGATASGAVAVLVTLVTNGATDAVVVLVVVLAVQQLEGNVLQPLVMGRAVHLHPVVTLVAVTAGTLLLGVPGALLAVPTLAVAYRVVEHVRTHPVPSPQG